MKELVIFDLDRTLLNLDYTENYCLSILHREHLESHIQFNDFLTIYSKHNELWWRKRSRNEADIEAIKVNRFRDTFAEIKISHLHAESFSQSYSSLARGAWKLYDGATELLQTLQKFNIKTAIITNGFSEIQRQKLKFVGIESYFSYLAISDEIQLAKPDPQIFLHVLEHLNISKESAVYIGDDYHDDLIAAIDFGVDFIWFNEKKLPVYPNVITVNHFKDLAQKVSQLCKISYL